jgi:CHAT domain-containing protein
MAERILIVEDNKNLRDDMRRSVEAARPGCDILEVENETKAVELINRTLFSVVVADIQLDEAGGDKVGGFTVLSEAKEREPHTQVIIITSYLTPERIKLIRQLDGFGYIDRTAEYYLDLLKRYVMEASELFEHLQKPRRAGLVFRYPDQSGGVPSVELVGVDSKPRKSRSPLILDVHLLEGATAAIDSLVHLREPKHRNALSQFVGQYIWNRLFGEHEVMTLALGEARGLVRGPAYLPLRFVSGSDALDLPFELAHDGRNYVARQHPLVRAVRHATPESPLLPTLMERLAHRKKPLRILLLASNTCLRELSPILSVDREIDIVKEAILKSLPLPFGPEIEIKTIQSWESSYEQVLRELKSGYHIIHYAGHSTYNQAMPGKSSLCFWEEPCQSPEEWREVSGELEEWYDVSKSERARLAARAQNLRGGLKNVTADELKLWFGPSAPSLVYLSSCHAGQSGSAHYLTFSKSLGLMDAVARAGVPIVMGHRWPLIDSKNSVRFVETFYKRLLAEYPPEQALLWARREVQLDDPIWASAVMIVQSF